MYIYYLLLIIFFCLKIIIIYNIYNEYEILIYLFISIIIQDIIAILIWNLNIDMVITIHTIANNLYIYIYIYIYIFFFFFFFFDLNLWNL